MKVVKKQLNSHDCIICGVDNPLGLKAPFYQTEDGQVASKFTFRSEHQSYPGRTHGGMICALLDELIGRAIWITQPNLWGVTMTLSIKYRKPVPYDVPLLAFGKIDSETTRTFSGSGHIEDGNGNVLAEATATYMKLPLSTISHDDHEHLEMFIVKDDVTEI